MGVRKLMFKRKTCCNALETARMKGCNRMLLSVLLGQSSGFETGGAGSRRDGMVIKQRNRIFRRGRDSWTHTQCQNPNLMETRRLKVL
jgi:hypothetical protein